MGAPCLLPAWPAQVQQITVRLQELKDAELAQEVQQQLLAAAAEQARDRQLAAAIGDCEGEGPSSREVEELAQRSAGTGAPIQLLLAFEAEIKAGEPGPAGCGAVLTLPAGAHSSSGMRAPRRPSAAPPALPRVRRAAHLGWQSQAMGA